jgi:hypothetical protein
MRCMNVNRLDMFEASSSEMEKANQMRLNMLSTLQKAAAARVKLDLHANVAFDSQEAASLLTSCGAFILQVTLTSVGSKGWTFRCGSRAISICIQDAPAARPTQ